MADDLKRLIAARGQLKGAITPPAMRSLISCVKQHLGALKNLGAPTSHWDLIIIAILHKKLDQYTLRAYHLDSQSNTDLPVLDDFLTFLEHRAAALETLGLREAEQPSKRRSSLVASKAKPIKNIKCKYCQSHVHKLHQCPSFKLAEPLKRKEFVDANKLCNICLNNHSDKKCLFTFKCSVCKGKHNSLLHEDAPQQNVIASQDLNQNKSAGQISLLTNTSNNVLLPTIKAKLYDKNGKAVFVRCLLDSGSQVSFVLSEVADQLGCKLQPSKSIITGVCDGVNMTTEQTTLNVHATATDFKIPVTCHVVKNITCNMPQFSVRNETIHFPSHVKLADDNFFICDKIGMLLGADVFFQVLLREQLPVPSSGLVLQNTFFGYVVAGTAGHSGASTSSCLASNFCCTQQTQDDFFSKLDHNVSQFWQSGKVPEVFMVGEPKRGFWDLLKRGRLTYWEEPSTPLNTSTKY
ncbi:hypothetical protein ABMA27_010334 [Loxostege sticticalis]|uniref:Peptidase aspartic putative domain-containing protein n=1 Tax=Loxostege sticticalis TaxID=481309 RepID=A0ABR3H5E0_LOXSC